MIIKGNKVNPCRRCGTSRSLAEHLQRTDTNELVEVQELRGFASGDLDGAFAEINGTAAATRAAKAGYHAKINPNLSETLTKEQALEAADALEHELGFDGQPRALVCHVKEGRQHFHVVWSRIDLEKMRAIDTPENFAAHERVARRLERDFELSPVRGVHGREQDTVRPERNSPEWEYQQADRLKGKSPREQKAEITALYAKAKTGAELQEALAEAGYTLAAGDKKGVYLVVDERGGFASLTRRVEGVKAAEVREKLADLDPKKLPTLDEARGQQTERQAAAEIEEKARPGQPSSKAAAAIFAAYQDTKTAPEFMSALSVKSCLLARVSAADEKHYADLREQARESGLTRLPPALKEGECVVVNQYGNALRLTERNTGAKREEIAGRLKELDGQAVPTVAAAMEQNRFAENLKGQAKAQEREERRATWEAEHPAGRYEKATENLAGISRDIGGGGVQVVGGAARLADSVMSMAEKILDLLCPPSPRTITPQEMFRNKEARLEREEQLEAEKKRDAALGRIAESTRRDNCVYAADLYSLSRRDLEMLRDRGDAALADLCRVHEKDRAQQRERMLER